MKPMHPKIRALLERLRELKKAHRQLRNAANNHHFYEQRVESVFREVLNMLDDPQVVDLLNDMIPDAAEKLHSQLDEIQRELREKHAEILAKEARALEMMQIKRRNLDDLLRDAQSLKKERADLVRENQSLRKLLETHHRQTLQTYRELREQKVGRKAKKRRKRNVGQGIVSTIFGVGAIAANTQFPNLAMFSYAFALTALHKASRDFVGNGDAGD